MNTEYWRSTELVDGHEWGFYKKDKFETCRKCGNVRRRDKKNSPCRGKVKITLRKFMKYRKKPIVIEATQWFKNGDHPNDFDKEKVGFESGELKTWSGAEVKQNGWEGQVVRYFRRPDVPGETPCGHCGKPMNDHGWIDTLEGGHNVCPGDWIITGVNGERYPCKPDIFDKTYEPA